MQLGCAVFAGVPFFFRPGPLFELQTGPTDFLILTDLQITAQVNPAATQLVALGLGKPAVKGVGVVNPLVPQPEDAGRTDDSPGIQLFTDWTTRPTAPANYLRRRSMSLVTASQNPPDFWRLSGNSGGIKILPNASLVLWCLTSAYAAGAGQGQLDITLNLDN